MKGRPYEDDLPPKAEWRQPNYKDIVRDQLCFQEDLPLRWVQYPDVYGTWLFFQKAEGSQPTLCTCMKVPARNFLLHMEGVSWFHPKFPNLLDYMLPPRLRSLNRCIISSIDELDGSTIFVDRACHLCNRRVPPIRWSNLGEHSAFIQHFGWYFHHALYAAGVSPYGEVIPERLDPELQPLILLDQKKTRAKIRELIAPRLLWHGALDGRPTMFDSPEIREARDLHHRLKRQDKSVWLLVEQRLRKSLGFPAPRKTGVSETILYWIVTALFSPNPVLFRSKPPFLDGMELDIFVPARSLGIEFQGEQHYLAFDHLGGEKHLRGVRKRDRLKSKLCKNAGVQIEYFSRADKLTEDFVRARLRYYMPPMPASLS